MSEPTVIGLEYLLLFGLPENKIEGLNEGRTVTSLAFPSESEAQMHFEAWLKTLTRWQGVRTRQRKGGQAARVRRFDLSRRKCVVSLLVPLSWVLLFNSWELEYEWALWSNRCGCCPYVDPFSLQSALERATGRHFSGTELLLTPSSMVAPSAYSFPAGLKLAEGSPEGERGLVGRQYYQGIPDIVVETVLPSTERELRGEKMAMYREAGLPELWLLHPEKRTIEVYERVLDRLALSGEFAAGEQFCSQGRSVDPADILPAQTAESQLQLRDDEGETAGLQQFLIAGLPSRRYEFYQGTCRRALAVPSLAQADRVELQTRSEISLWDPEGKTFRLTRQGQLMRLEVRINPSVHRRMFRNWHFSGIWK